MAAVRTLIVDDDDDMRFLIRTIIEAANEGLSVAGEAAHGSEGLEAWRNDQPDVVILDQRMPGMTGLELAEKILTEAPDQAIILFSAYLDDTVTRRANELGVRACLAKDAYQQIPEALRQHGPDR
ncbi:MAG: response regulator transcription factor [Acidobacteria bacterium]|nr:response regulator transcription factor [Acidobacteriota bacterium]